MRRLVGCVIGLAALLTLGFDAPVEATSGATEKDVVELDLSGFTGCPGYATLAGASFTMACQKKNVSYFSPGSEGKEMTLGGGWAVVCPDGVKRTSRSYEYKVRLVRTPESTTSAIVWGPSPCPGQAYRYFSANVYQRNSPYGVGRYYVISVTDTWYQQ